jgi:hypothetical protein
MGWRDWFSRQKSTVVVRMDLTREVYARLVGLFVLAGVTDLVSYLRQALAAYEAVLSARRRGERVAIIDKDGVTRDLTQ